MKRGYFKSYSVVAALAALMLSGSAVAWEATTKALNQGGMIETRHNMTMSYLDGNETPMNNVRNNYIEICVYCHTPHASNTNINAPLWNRGNAVAAADFQTYSDSRQLLSGQTASSPGPNSMTCLSCHDGATAIDAILNMPGSGMYSSDPSDTAHLDSWGDPVATHATLSNCTICHDKDGPLVGTPDFTVFVIGDLGSTNDLRNDHPVGVLLPDTAKFDFNQPDAVDGTLTFYDSGTLNGRADKNEIRFYDSGDGFEVECASCHDPHGVESAGAGSVYIDSFLRVDNTGSALCLACHDK